MKIRHVVRKMLHVNGRTDTMKLNRRPFQLCERAYKPQFKIRITRMKNVSPPLQQMVTRTHLDVTSHEHCAFTWLDELSHGAPHTDTAHDSETPGTKRPSAGRVLLSCTDTAHHTANEIRRHWQIKINLYWNKTHFQSRSKCDYT